MMAALASGFLRRISREAQSYADRRPIGPAPPSAIRFARYRLKAIETSHTICEALNHYLLTELTVKADMTGAFPAVQALKTVSTERMLSSAHHHQQLVGSEGYRCGSPTNIAAQAFLTPECSPSSTARTTYSANSSPSGACRGVTAGP
jgi:hypothetical protein